MPTADGCAARSTRRTSASLRSTPARRAASAAKPLQFGHYLSAIFQRNADNFRLFGPDETASNRLTPVFDVTSRSWMADIEPYDEQLARDGRVMEILSEHQCQGWLEGYLLTGRHGLFNCYEAFIHIVDSMFNQHAKWLKVTRKLGWRKPISSLNYLLSSHVWRRITTDTAIRIPVLSITWRIKGGYRAHLSAAGRKHPALGGRSLSAHRIAST